VLLLGLAPVSNLIPLGEISAERFLYFPSMGFALVLGALFSGAYKNRTAPARSVAESAQQFVRKNRSSKNPKVKSSKNKARQHKTAEKSIGNLGGTIVLLVFLSVLIAYSLRTFTRNMDWKDESELFAKSVAAAPENPRTHINMGRALRDKGKIQEAIAEYKKALEIKPDYVGAMSGLAAVYQNMGKTDEAVQLLQEALQISPNDDELHNNLGVIFMTQEKYSEAKNEFQETIRYNHNNMRGYFNLGLTCFMLKEDDNALQYFERAKKSGDAFAAAYYYIGLISAGTGRHEYARRCLEHFLSIHHSKDLERERAEAALRELKEVSRIPPK
jgi:Flp pilus assembly protein TadD